MRIYDIIKSKRDNNELTTEEIEYFVQSYSNNTIKDYQASALLMAIFLNKMNARETLDLTRAMVDSGDKIDLSKIKGIKVDKHSTGGVADSTTLVLGPMIAACNLPFVKMSGRGLGHTGGTLDKLDSIKDFDTDLSINEFINNSNKINLCIGGQTANIAPADKKIYALRDVTATVDNMSLIASSVMSKKLALGSDAIVLDVKVGKGAFMKTLDDAITLSKEMVEIGKGANIDTVAIVTDMNQPLGNNIGNALEVREAIEILKGKHLDGDLYKVSLSLGEELLFLSGKVEGKNQARNMLEETIKNGTAFKKFIDMVKLQGGQIDMINNLDMLPKTETITPVISDTEGYVDSLNAEEIGKCSLLLGAGREDINSKINLASGIVLNKRVGDYVNIGDVLAYIHSDDPVNIEIVKNNIKDIYKIESNNIGDNKLIYALIDFEGVQYY